MSMHLLPISTERLLLRPFTPDDVDDLYAYQGLSEVARYLYRPPLTREQCVQSLVRRAAGTAWAEDGDDLVVAVCPVGEEGKPGGPDGSGEPGGSGGPQVVGEVVLKLASAQSRQVEIGWSLNPAYNGRGYATEAARAVAGLAFAELGAHRLFARLDVLNTGSARVCERLGMRREAHLVENDLDGERWGSEYVYAMLAREWNADRA